MAANFVPSLLTVLSRMSDLQPHTAVASRSSSHATKHHRLSMLRTYTRPPIANVHVAAMFAPRGKAGRTVLSPVRVVRDSRGTR